jgi:hypothetical protein
MTSRIFSLVTTATVLTSMAIAPSGAYAHGFGGGHWGGNATSTGNLVNTMKSGDSTLYLGENFKTENRRLGFEEHDRDFFRWHRHPRKIVPLMLGPGPALPPAATTNRL